MSRRLIQVPLILLLAPGIQGQSNRQEEEVDYFRRWLETDVVYIISAEEREIFQELSTVEEKERFIEAFWTRRDTDPRTVENEFKEEHYRRIAFANERFSAGLPGWKTDRGRVYIQYGDPAQIDHYPTGTTLQDIRGGVARALEGGHGEYARPREVQTKPFEVWNYRYIEGVGNDVQIEFVDRTGSGLYSLALDPEEKNAFAYQDPMADITSINRSDQFQRTRDRQFYRTEMAAAVFAPPPVEFSDLQAAVTSRVTYNDLPFEVSTAVTQVTESSFYVPVTFLLRAANLDFRLDGKTYRAAVNLLIQATDVRKRIVGLAEDTLSVAGPVEQLDKMRMGTTVYQKKLLLGPGRYIVDVILKDTNSGKIGTVQKLVVIPRAAGDLRLSSVIVADAMRPLGGDEERTGPFTIGSFRVMPNVSRRYGADQQLGLFFEAYGLQLDQATFQPDAEVEVTFRQGERTLASLGDDFARFGSLHGRSAVFTIALPLRKFPPGPIAVEVKVTDRLSGRSVSGATDFSVMEPAASGERVEREAGAGH